MSTRSRATTTRLQSCIAGDAGAESRADHRTRRAIASPTARRHEILWIACAWREAVEEHVTFAAPFVRHLLSTAVHLGVNEQALLLECGIDSAQLADPIGRVPAIGHDKLWRGIETRVGSESLAAAASDLFRPASFGIAGLLACAAPRISAMGAMFERYGRLVGASHLVPVVEKLPGDQTRFRFRYPRGLARYRERAETGTLTVLKAIRHLAGFDGKPVEVSFQFDRPGAVHCYEDWFDTPVAFNTAETTITLPIAFSQPLLTSAPEVGAYLAQYADILLQQSQRPLGFAARVQEALSAALRTGRGSATHIAAMLRLSERTLQRYLRSEGTSFAEVLETTRRELALVHLRDPQLSVEEIALLLGYSDARPFARAFRAWTGTTPSAYRRKHLRAASG